MVYLSGVVRPELASEVIGFMLTPNMGNRVPEGAVWAADTGCYSQGASFDLGNYFHWLDKQPRMTCCFATAPDVVGNSEATWTLSKPVLPALRKLGFPAALVAQDGLEDPDWDSFDALFIGGTTRWKLADTGGLAAEAKRRGKWLHMGRVNSYKRLKAAAILGCDSVDGTFLRRAPEVNVPRMLWWLRNLSENPVMVMG